MIINNEINIKEVVYKINEHSLHGITFGNDDNPVTLCLHGWLDNAASFLPMFPYLAKRKIIAIDWPGHGFSSHRSLDAHYHFIDWVYDLVQLFETAKWQSVDIIAHSMGGMVATAFAAAFPEKVKSLILLDTIGFISEREEKTTEQLRKGLISRVKGRTKQKHYHLTTESAVLARVAVSDMKSEQAKLLVNRGLMLQDNNYIWRADSRLRVTSPYRLTMKQAKQLISDVKCPVHLIYGDKGLAMVQHGIKIFAPLFKQLTITKVVGGHHVHMEKPEQIVEAIKPFWSSLVK